MVTLFKETKMQKTLQLFTQFDTDGEYNFAKSMRKTTKEKIDWLSSIATEFSVINTPSYMSVIKNNVSAKDIHKAAIAELALLDPAKAAQLDMIYPG